MVPGRGENERKDLIRHNDASVPCTAVVPGVTGGGRLVPRPGDHADLRADRGRERGPVGRPSDRCSLAARPGAGHAQCFGSHTSIVIGRTRYGSPGGPGGSGERPMSSAGEANGSGGGSGGDVGAVVGPAEMDALDNGVKPTSRAAARSGPVAATESTRPPAETTLPSDVGPGPACSTASASAPVMMSPVTGVPGVVLRGDDDRDRGAVLPSQIADRRKITVGGRGEHACPRGAQQFQHDLCLGIYEPVVEPDDLGPSAVSTSPAEQQPGERGAAVVDTPARPRRGWCDALGDQVGRRPGHRCVPRPCRRWVGARVAVANALEVWAGSSGIARVPSHAANRLKLRAGQDLFDQDGMARGQDSLGVCECLPGVVGHDDPIAGGKTVVFDHVRAAAGPSRLDAVGCGDRDRAARLEDRRGEAGEAGAGSTSRSSTPRWLTVGCRRGRSFTGAERCLPPFPLRRPCTRHAQRRAAHVGAPLRPGGGRAALGSGSPGGD